VSLARAHEARTGRTRRTPPALLFGLERLRPVNETAL